MLHIYLTDWEQYWIKQICWSPGGWYVTLSHFIDEFGQGTFRLSVCTHIIAVCESIIFWSLPYVMLQWAILSSDGVRSSQISMYQSLAFVDKHWHPDMLWFLFLYQEETFKKHTRQFQMSRSTSLPRMEGCMSTVAFDTVTYRVSQKKVYSSILGSIPKQYDVIKVYF